MAGRGRKLETRQGRVVEPDPHRSVDRPLHAEQIRRSLEARKGAVKGLVVGPDPHRSEDRPLLGELDPGAVRVPGRAGSDRRSWS